MTKIAVIGAGINGLASAVKIKETYKDAQVVIISTDFTPNTTGDGSGGLWFPYLCGSTPEESLKKWGSETYKLYHKLWLEGGHNICLVPINYLYRENKDLQRPAWANSVFGYQILSKEQLQYYSKMYNSKYKSGLTFSTFVVHSPTILKYLFDIFKRADGKILCAEVTSMKDPLLDDFDVVVNCSGLGSRVLVPDEAVFPVRGQISKVVAPWMSEAIIADNKGDCHYILPNTETCVLGGTHQENNFSTQVDEDDTRLITDGCTSIIPALKHAPLATHWVGLRPGRHTVRIEPEERGGKLFIHNYGHGGSGLSLFWGCADEVLEILKEKRTFNKMSKL